MRNPHVIDFKIGGERMSVGKKQSNGALRRAIEIVGSQAKLAEKIDTAQSTVWYWLNRKNGKVPHDYCAPIAKATKNRVTKEELRPDLFIKD